MWLWLQVVAFILVMTAMSNPTCPTDETSSIGDAEAGRLLYVRCGACHSPGRNRTGPRHCGLLGRISGTVNGYEYSEAMRAAEIEWDAESLDRFLSAPLKMIPGTAMGYAGVADKVERRDLIAWLATLNETSEFCSETSVQ